MKTSQILLTVSLLISGLAFADGRGADARTFNQEMKIFAETCPNLECHEPYVIRPLLTADENLLSRDLQRLLFTVANDQAQIWGDTILEGDYYAAGNTRLDEVLAIYKNGDLIGYRITYSEKAWNTADCRFDGRDESQLEACESGRIVESSFVSAPVTSYLRDSNQFAEFASEE